MRKGTTHLHMGAGRGLSGRDLAGGSGLCCGGCAVLPSSVRGGPPWRRPMMVTSKWKTCVQEAVLHTSHCAASEGILTR